MSPAASPSTLLARILRPGEGSFFMAAREGGPELFEIHGGVPGDRVRIRPRPDDPPRADLLEVLEAGPGRRTAPCRWAGVCGGCPWMQMTPTVQQEWRHRRLLEAFGEAGIDPGPAEWEMIPAPAPRAGRCRMRAQTHFSAARQAIGFHRLGSPTTLDVESCAILSPEAATLYRWLREWLLAHPDPDLTGFEWTAFPGGSGALVYLNPRDREPCRWPGLGEELLKDGAGLIAGVAVRPSRKPGLPDRLGADAVLGRTPAGLPVAAAARGFVQADLGAAELLAQRVVDSAGAAPGVRILELFSGSGLLGWRMARRGAAVLALEQNAEAEAAVALLPPPIPGQLEHRRADARQIADLLTGTRWNAVVADPPRTGLGPAAALLGALGPSRLVLVHCSSRGLTADLKVLLPAGYRLQGVTLVDLFPETRHIETVTRLHREPTAG